MCEFDVLTVGLDASTPDVFEAQVRQASGQGYSLVALDGLAGPTPEQRTSTEDTWEFYAVINAAMYKIVETDLIHGYFLPETYARNRVMLRWQSALLQRHGMGASIRFLEPIWMPEPWYATHPGLKGCRCDQPGVSRSAHYALNIDHPLVLEHYYQLARGLVELAPAVQRIVIWTNDSGAGINWCRGLYPGPNGPAEVRDRDMGERVQSWFQAIRDGSRAGGRELVVDFVGTHFTPAELQSTARALRPPSRLVCVSGFSDPVNLPFSGHHLHTFAHACQGTETRPVAGMDPAGKYWWNPMVAPPLLFMGGEMVLSLRETDVRTIECGYTAPGPLPGTCAPLQMLLDRCLAHCPANVAGVDRMVAELAVELVGPVHAAALESAWRDVQQALLVHPIRYDHSYYFFYSILGRRWLTRPFVPVPAALDAEERGYWSAHAIKDRDLELGFRTLLASENTVLYALPEYAWRTDGLEAMQLYFGRALRTLDAACAQPGTDATHLAWLRDQRDRIDMFASLFRCQLHATAVQWVIDRFAGHPLRDKWAQPREKRRLYDMIDGDIANCRRIIALLHHARTPLIATGEESTFCLPVNLPELLERKIMTMCRHRARVEELFPGVSDSIAPPSYAEDGSTITVEESASQLAHPKNLSTQQ